MDGSGSGFANSLKWEPANPTEQKNTADLLGLGNESSGSSFGQPASRNPFGQSNTTQQQWSSPRPGQKSLVELMQEQKQQQQLQQQHQFQQQQQANPQQPQMTGFGGVQPQSTGWNNGQQQHQFNSQNAFF